MKTFRTLLLLVLSFQVFGQNEAVVGDFKADELNGKVYLTWHIKQGETCNGIQILRSTDSVNFTQIASIEGTCGSIQQDVFYDHTDLYPIKNAINYYRLSLGGVGFSKTIQIEIIDIGKNSYMLRPNPIDDQSELHFSNDGNHVMSMKIYSSDGKLLRYMETSEEVIFLNKSDFNSGGYLFTLTNGTKQTVIRGRFEVQ